MLGWQKKRNWVVGLNFHRVIYGHVGLKYTIIHFHSLGFGEGYTMMMDVREFSWKSILFLNLKALLSQTWVENNFKQRLLYIKCWNGREGFFWIIQEFKWGVVPEDSYGEPYWYASTYHGDVGIQDCFTTKLSHRQWGALQTLANKWRGKPLYDIWSCYTFALCCFCSGLCVKKRSKKKNFIHIFLLSFWKNSSTLYLWLVCILEHI